MSAVMRELQDDREASNKPCRFFCYSDDSFNQCNVVDDFEHAGAEHTRASQEASREDDDCLAKARREYYDRNGDVAPMLLILSPILFDLEAASESCQKPRLRWLIFDRYLGGVSGAAQRTHLTRERYVIMLFLAIRNNASVAKPLPDRAACLRFFSQRTGAKPTHSDLQSAFKALRIRVEDEVKASMSDLPPHLSQTMRFVRATALVAADLSLECLDPVLKILSTPVEEWP